eukprot:s86_g9.t1
MYRYSMKPAHKAMEDWVSEGYICPEEFFRNLAVAVVMVLLRAGMSPTSLRANAYQQGHVHGGRGADIREVSRLQRNRPSCTAVDRFGEAGLYQPQMLLQKCAVK